MPEQKKKTPEQEIRDLRAEVKEEHKWRMRLHSEIKDAKRIEEDFARMRVSLYEATIQERTELISRVQRCEQRIKFLGFQIPGQDKSS